METYKISRRIMFYPSKRDYNTDMPILISDMGGVLHSFDPSHDPVKHLEAFDVAMKDMGLENGDLNSKLEGEYKAIQSGDLVAYPIKTGIENLKENMKTCKVVIVSMSPIKTSK